jgi:hypothetical protein
MNKKMVVLRRFSDSVAAETLRGRLAVAGIDVYVRGTSVEAAFGLGGAPTSSGLRVEIASDDVDAALAILAEDDRIREVAGAWVCPRCDEENEASFEVCWNCQKQRGPGDTKKSPVSAQVNPITAPESLVARRAVVDDKRSTNPYQPVLLEPQNTVVGTQRQYPTTLSDETIDNLMRDFYRLACVSVLIVPIPLALYAVYRIWLLPTELKRHPDVRKRVRRYFLINVFVAAIVVSFWSALFIHWLR